MPEVTAGSFPEEYTRTPTYGRPPGASLVRTLEKVLKGSTQVDAMKPEA